MKEEKQLPLILTLVGKIFRDIEGEKCHVVNVFVDDGNHIITYKTWSSKKKTWFYHTKYESIFRIQFSFGAKWIN